MPFCRHDLPKNFNDRKLEKTFFVSLKNVEQSQTIKRIDWNLRLAKAPVLLTPHP
jgi:hypothetical protein